MAASQMNVEQRYPELFAQLDDKQRRAVVQSIAAGWHEGWEPTREDVENLTDYARGAIDADEYDRRSDAAARRAAEVGVVLLPRDVQPADRDRDTAQQIR